MDYNCVYNLAFNNKSYSIEHHIQYDYALNHVKRLNLDNNNIIDVGSGRGHIIKMLNESNIKNLLITSVDLEKFHNQSINTFIKCDLSKSENRNNLLSKNYDILICTDVLEHLDKSFIEDVIKIFSELSKYSILCIANHSDIINNIELHTIQENDIWWENLLSKYFKLSHKEVHYDGRLYEYFCESLSFKS